MHNNKITAFWAGAIFFSLLLNMFLFFIMSTMVDIVPGKRMFPEYVGGIDLIHLKPQPPKGPDNSPKVREQPETTSRKLRVNLEHVAQTVHVKPHLSFKINPRLPADLGIDLPTKLFVAPPQIRSCYSVGDLDSPLMPVVRIKPFYPRRAQLLGIEGWVKVEFLVDEKGNTHNIKILAAQPRDIFSRSTLDAVSRWKFNPPTVNGHSVKALVRTTIRYKLQ